ncbi:MAG: ABC transporter ATP-binding protein [Actinobacteria bacterium]|nr:ABC transporter ATP-binding protein [Actinomycetota bacterium]
MAILEVRHLNKTYGTGPDAHIALSNVDLAVAEGQFVSIVGPSGCGKTTLMKCIAGLVKPTTGSVTLMGRPVDGVPDDLAVVFQDYSRSLFPLMRVAQNIEFPLKALGVAKAERQNRVAESLAAVNLADKGNRYPWELSGGMQQRVAIARALAYRPRVLLMDEPFASVDAQTRSELEDLTRLVHRRFGMTILFVTHDIDESIYLADRVVVLRRSPGGILTELDVRLSGERDQIATKAAPEFVQMRREVAQYIRDAGAPTTLAAV